MDKIIAKRSLNWSHQEEEALADAMTKYGEIIKARFNPELTHSKKKQAWESITALVNAVGGNNRDTDQIKKKYYNITCAAKRQNSNNQRAMRKTGGGDSETKPLSSTQEKLLSTIPAVSISGIEGGYDLSEKDKDESPFSELEIFNVESLSQPSLNLGLVCVDETKSISTSTTFSTEQTATPNDLQNLSSKLTLKSRRSLKRKLPVDRLSPQEELLKRQVDLFEQQLAAIKEGNELTKERIRIEKERNEMLQCIMLNLKRNGNDKSFGVD